ncbi:MAG: glmU [Burkholderiales bacterium]|jgi:bifunctional UDP-N-acetylglucosamine pyrophosphorylase/glucosamine-1-phosphate N-acetyltransferase|nr:glmU [Burkholderiales bacterium]
MTKINIVILAAGQGKRMNSSLPKVLHKVGNKSMLEHVITTALSLNPENLIIVYGHGGDIVKSSIDEVFVENKFIWAFQDKQHGTGHALRCALPHIDNDGATLVLYGDVPLISSSTLHHMQELYDGGVVMLTAQLNDPTGYGRVVRDEGFQIKCIVEEKDATQSEKFITEINTGFYILPNRYLAKWLNSLENNNNQDEYYLTDVIAKAYRQHIEIRYYTAAHNYEIMGVNNKLQLEYLERVHQCKLAEALLEGGATLLDKSRIDIRGKISCGMDCIIDVNCIFEGTVILGNNVTIGAGSLLKNVIIGNNVTIKPYSIIEDAKIGIDSLIGPFARIRPGTELTGGAHVGNFVEIKNSIIGQNSKVNHLTYIGDSTIGSGVNVGAGSVTCNYDGKNKYKTIIEDNVFIGSGTMMVAPVTISHGSVIGAGSTITKTTEANELTVSRAKQVTVKGWVAKHRDKK